MRILPLGNSTIIRLQPSAVGSASTEIGSANQSGSAQSDRFQLKGGAVR